MIFRAERIPGPLSSMPGMPSERVNTPRHAYAWNSLMLWQKAAGGGENSKE